MGSLLLNCQTNSRQGACPNLYRFSLCSNHHCPNQDRNGQQVTRSEGERTSQGPTRRITYGPKVGKEAEEVRPRLSSRNLKFTTSSYFFSSASPSSGSDSNSDSGSDSEDESESQSDSSSGSSRSRSRSRTRSPVRNKRRGRSVSSTGSLDSRRRGSDRRRRYSSEEPSDDDRRRR